MDHLESIVSRLQQAQPTPTIQNVSALFFDKSYCAHTDGISNMQSTIVTQVIPHPRRSLSLLLIFGPSWRNQSLVFGAF